MTIENKQSIPVLQSRIWHQFFFQNYVALWKNANSIEHISKTKNEQCSGNDVIWGIVMSYAPLNNITRWPIKRQISYSNAFKCAKMLQHEAPICQFLFDQFFFFGFVFSFICPIQHVRRLGESCMVSCLYFTHSIVSQQQIVTICKTQQITAKCLMWISPLQYLNKYEIICLLLTLTAFFLTLYNPLLFCLMFAVLSSPFKKFPDAL